MPIVLVTFKEVIEEYHDRHGCYDDGGNGDGEECDGD